MKENGQFKIEKGIAVPTIGRRGRRPKYPWAGMKVGDSFVVTGHDGNSIRSAASIAGIRNKMQFTVANEANGHRVWRIK